MLSNLKSEKFQIYAKWSSSAHTHKMKVENIRRTRLYVFIFLDDAFVQTFVQSQLIVLQKI